MIGKAMRFATVCTLAFAICGEANRDKVAAVSRGTTEDLEPSKTSLRSRVWRLAVLALSSAVTPADGFGVLTNNPLDVTRLQPLSQHDNLHQSPTISKRPATTKLCADAVDNRDMNDEAMDNQIAGEGQSRRSIFLNLPAMVVSVATAGAGIEAAPRINDLGNTIGATGTSIPIPPPVTTMYTQALKSLQVGDALTLIEDMCDRKFLRAVVASDYRFLYRGMSLPWEPLPTVVEKEMSDLLLPGTYGEDSLEAVRFFRELDVAMASKPVRPGVNGHLGTTSTRDAAAWGSPASIWPLSGLSEDNYAHFAFYEDGGAFYPRPKAWSKTAKSVDDGIIVDGINCGAVNLEDALRSKDNEIMFSTESYLAIPAEWDQELREGLRNAFIL